MNSSRSHGEGAYCLVPHGLLSLLSQTTEGHLPKGDTAHSELGPLT